ncbi:MAG: DUF2784 domain-containing protein [Fuerstiella sp.]|nr:DUF2784 domain-containing protein [Fuerstiella sp.]MCP4859218.1 DUF2784 domain-containing protein [Fuerstiella sp.]
MLQLLNITCFVLHNALIVFNLVGWIWPRTRRLHLLALGATLFSWLVMGAWYGWGYCLCADWHFQIRRQLGLNGGESSYTELLFNQIPGVTVSRTFADIVTVGCLMIILIATAAVWIRQWRITRASPKEPDTTSENSAVQPLE